MLDREREPFNDTVLNQPFDKFTAQCSHNTYIWGKQSALPFHTAFSVDPRTIIMALDLGYRCFELDVWPRTHPAKIAEKWDGPGIGEGKNWDSLLKVSHSLESLTNSTNKHVTHMTNSKDLTLFIKMILLWCEANEKEKTGLKMPLAISVENRMKSEEEETQAFQIFSWLDKSLAGRDATRIVRPESFRPGTHMSELVANGPDELRKIIIKTKAGHYPQSATGTGYSKFATIVAMNHKKSPGPSAPTYLSKSIAMPNSQKEQLKESLQTKIEKVMKPPDGNWSTLVRTYPHNLAVTSANYQPYRAFRAGAQMVCINVQGHCPLKNNMCTYLRPSNRGKTDDCGGCKRDVAGRLENIFQTHGYDGWMTVEVASNLNTFPRTL